LPKRTVSIPLSRTCLELCILCDVDLCRAERPSGIGERAHACSDHDSGDVVVAESRGLREHAERALQKLVAVVFEKDERAHWAAFAQ
jgi:hypothetical protein